jgi:hypothetical protein
MLYYAIPSIDNIAPAPACSPTSACRHRSCSGSILPGGGIASSRWSAPASTLVRRAVYANNRLPRRYAIRGEVMVRNEAGSGPTFDIVGALRGPAIPNASVQWGWSDCGSFGASAEVFEVRNLLDEEYVGVFSVLDPSAVAIRTAAALVPCGVRWR